MGFRKLDFVHSVQLPVEDVAQFLLIALNTKPKEIG